MNDRKPFVDFDVASDFSLDTLREELSKFIDPNRTEVLFNIWGPGGGNTQVLVYTEDETQMLEVLLYMKKHKLGLFMVDADDKPITVIKNFEEKYE